MVRERLFTMKISDEEHERFNAVAESHGLSVANVIRMLMKREETMLAIDAKDRAAGAVRKREADKVLDELRNSWKDAPVPRVTKKATKK